uniref:Uncharacterized protein n=1 Tax=Romanomermis culicivorax TaxID=13658 RepID=A0A915JAF7_ROMCU
MVVKEEGVVFTDSLISMDDNYLFVSAWVPGYIRQYDISDKFRPKLINAYDAGQKTAIPEPGLTP